MSQSNRAGGGLAGFGAGGEQGQDESGRFQPYVLYPGSPSAFACFGTWENTRTCMPLGEAEDLLDGCPQARECRRFTLEQNPPTTRFSIKPRRDGRFEVQQFRDFIRENTSYQLTIEPGQILVTFPGKRSVPKSKRFFLHRKHVEEAGLDIDLEFDLMVSAEKMVLRQAGDMPIMTPNLPRHREEDPEERRRRIAEKLRKRRRFRRDEDEDEEDIQIELGVDDEELPARRRRRAKRRASNEEE